MLLTISDKKEQVSDEKVNEFNYLFISEGFQTISDMESEVKSNR